jgi:hypothetical protein
MKLPDSAKSFETIKLPVIENPEQNLSEITEFINKLKSKEKISLKEVENLLETKKYLIKEDFGFTLVTRKKLILELNFLLAKGIYDQAQDDYQPDQRFQNKLNTLIPEIIRTLSIKNNSILDIVDRVNKGEIELNQSLISEYENEAQRLIILMSIYQIKDKEFCDKLSIFIEEINLLYSLKEI